MTAAFLTALQRWAQRHHVGRFVIPAGRVDAGELVKVVLALISIRKT
jgi:hypothetical protein